MAFGRVLAADDGELPERALQRRREESDSLHAAAARRRDDGRPHPEELQNHQLDQPAGMDQMEDLIRLFHVQLESLQYLDKIHFYLGFYCEIDKCDHVFLTSS